MRVVSKHDLGRSSGVHNQNRQVAQLDLINGTKLLGPVLVHLRGITAKLVQVAYDGESLWAMPSGKTSFRSDDFVCDEVHQHRDAQKFGEELGRSVSCLVDEALYEFCDEHDGQDVQGADCDC